MAWFTYSIQLKCENCGCDNDLGVKKGVAVPEFLKSKDCKCKNCGCKIKDVKEYSTEYID